MDVTKIKNIQAVPFEDGAFILPDVFRICLRPDAPRDFLDLIPEDEAERLRVGPPGPVWETLYISPKFLASSLPNLAYLFVGGELYIVKPEQLPQSEKLIDVGRFSAGIAHDLNNVFTGVLSLLSLLRSKLERKDLDKIAESIESGLYRASDMTRSITSYLREEDLGQQRIDPIGNLSDLLLLLQSSLGSRITLKVQLPEDRGVTLEISRSEFSQLILNLVLNARDALDGKGEVKLTGHYKPVKDPRFFVIDIEDEGKGIPPDELTDIFAPFYTTKKGRQGLGLGLSTVKSILDKVSGRINVTSKPGAFTRFSIELPIIR